MEEAIKPFLAPAVFVAMLTLIIQGILSITNIILQKRSINYSSQASRVNYVTSLFNLIDGLPLSDGEKAAKKALIAKQMLPDNIPECLTQLL